MASNSFCEWKLISCELSEARVRAIFRIGRKFRCEKPNEMCIRDSHKRNAIDYCGEIFDEKLEHRLYCPVYDITHLLKSGKLSLIHI